MPNSGFCANSKRVRKKCNRSLASGLAAHERRSSLLSTLRLLGKQYYVRTLMALLPRALMAAARVDTSVQRTLTELAGGQDRFRVRMEVLSGPGFTIEVGAEGSVRLVRESDNSTCHLLFSFKQLDLAFLVLTFQENTALAYAHHRMVVHGQAAHAVRFVRCLNRVEALILPKILARRALKCCPDIPLGEKVCKALSVYGWIIKYLTTGCRQ